MNLRNLKGTKDFLPEEQIYRYKIRRVCEGIFQKYAYVPMETPILNYFELLASKYAGGAEVLKEVFRLKDQGERELALRYDLTVPFAKVIGMNPYLTLPFKRYEIGKVFRDGPVKTGRMREFTQCDVDVTGIKSMMAEAELLTILVEVFEQLSLDITIQYNNRKLLRGILSGVGVKEERINKVILILDKMEKVGVSEVSRELGENGVDSKTTSQILKALRFKEEDSGNKFEFFLNSFDNQAVKEGVKELRELNEYLQILSLSNRVKFNPFLARGLDFYTGTVYEAFLIDHRITSSVAAGGRYDRIIGDLLANGREYPVIGLSFGLDVIYSALKLNGEQAIRASADVYIIPLGTVRESLELANQLRQDRIAVDIEMDNRKLKKSLDYANKKGIPLVIILGENELKAGIVKIKNMLTGQNSEVVRSELTPYLRSLIPKPGWNLT